MIPCGLIKAMEKSCCKVSDPTCSTLIQTPVLGLQVPGKHHQWAEMAGFLYFTVFFDETAKNNSSLGWRLKFDTTGASRYRKVFEMQKLSKLWGASTNAELAVEMTMKWENPCTARWVNQWIKEPVEQWIRDRNQQINESTNQWVTESVDQRLRESTKQWTRESTNQWVNQPLNQWISDGASQWINEPVNQWSCDSMNQ